ncbi:MAG: hypothetical protein RMM16_00215 [Chloroherpetonaceae bacterium]|nr:hypothetical protein [Chloroherpetonaceae bacterium]
MAKRIPILLALSFLFLAAELANAQHVYTASSRLIRAQEALTPKAKSLTYYTHSDMNVVTNAYGGNLGNTVAHSLIRNSMHLDYSFTNNILFALNALVYQDIHHRDKASNFFENITLATKIGGFSFANDHIYAGGMLTFMIPLAGEQYYNAYGVPYSAGGTETSLNVLLSYYADNLFPKESFNANLNLGFYGYFDDGKNISNNSRPLRVIGNSSSLNYSLSLKYPTAVVDLMLEFWGWAWITQPALQAYSRESMSFLSLGARIKPVDYLSVLLGYDYQLSGKTDETTYDGLFDIVPRPGGGKATNYTEWRFILGIQVNILPLSFGSTTADPRSVDFSAESQGADVIIRKLEDIGEDKEITSRKIQEIQRRRQDIDKNLQQLRQILKISEPAPTSSAMPTPAPSPAPTVAPAPAPAPAQEPPKEEPKKEEETPKKKPVRKRK